MKISPLENFNYPLDLTTCWLSLTFDYWIGWDWIYYHHELRNLIYWTWKLCHKASFQDVKLSVIFLLCVLLELKVGPKLYFLFIDQTFFIAALLAMQYDKALVWIFLTSLNFDYTKVDYVLSSVISPICMGTHIYMYIFCWMSVYT